MSWNLQNQIDRLYNRMFNLIATAYFSTVDDSKNVQYAQVVLNDNERRDNTPRLAEFGFTSNPPIGSDAVVIFIGGDRSNGVIIATGDQATRPKGLASGESMQYDAFGKYIYLKADGTIEIQANGGDVNVLDAANVTVNASVKVRLVTPLLEVTGDIIDNCDTQTRTMAGMREVYDIHTHNGVMNGIDDTDVPNQEM